MKEIEAQVDVEVPAQEPVPAPAPAPAPASDDIENAITSTVIEKPKKPRTQKQKESLQKAQQVRQEKIRMRLEKDDKQHESRLNEYTALKDMVKAQQIELQRMKEAQEPVGLEVEEAEEIEKKPRKRRQQQDKKTQESKVEDVVSKMTKAQYMRMLGF